MDPDDRRRMKTKCPDAKAKLTQHKGPRLYAFHLETPFSLKNAPTHRGRRVVFSGSSPA